MKKSAQDKQNSVTIIKAISGPTKIIKAGEKRAKADRRSFSNYVATLIEADIKSASEANRAKAHKRHLL